MTFHSRTYGLIIGCVTGLSVGCGAGDVVENVSQNDERDDKIVDVAQTPVERQTIGNCWIYAYAGWAESRHLAATGVVFDISQSAWTYMHWFDQIVNSDPATLEEISTGGNFYQARSITDRYGVFPEAYFLPVDSNSESSFAQSSALARLNDALKSDGALGTAEKRADGKQVRAVMDQAWGLSEQVIADMNLVFKSDMSQTLDRDATAAGTQIIPADEFEVAYTNGTTGTLQTKTLADAIYEWQYANYSSWNRGATLHRVQRALHAREPVMISWFVDFNALEDGAASDRYGSFNNITLENAGRPGRQGGHLTVLEDYEALISLTGEPETVFSATAQKVEKAEFVTIHSEGQPEESPLLEIEAQQSATIKMTGDNDADLYVQDGQLVSKSNYSCRPYKGGSDEECSITGPATIYVAVDGFQTSNFNIEVTVATIEQRLLEAGKTLDPEKEDEKALLDAALGNDTEIVFFRIKNSWGANRAGLAMAPGPLDEDGVLERGYHDLYMDYLDGPIAEADSCPDGFDSAGCIKDETPLRSFILPPGY